jgi:hypothetical protein
MVLVGGFCKYGVEKAGDKCDAIPFTLTIKKYLSWIENELGLEALRMHYGQSVMSDFYSGVRRLRRVRRVERDLSSF